MSRIGFAFLLILTISPSVIAQNEQDEHLWNPIFLSSLDFLKFPVPTADATATTEDDMKPYTETIPGTEISFKMLPIKGGTFQMGSPEDEPGRRDDEGPRHEVEIKPFWMEEHETTWIAFEQFALKHLRFNRKNMAPPTARERVADAFAAPTNLWGTSPSHANRGKPGYPASSMTLYAAQAYCKWLTIMTGRYYRLPTEAEWEYACRAGSEGAYSFGRDAENIDDFAWHFGNSNEQAHKVKQKKPNAWGLYDMHGNVAEWVLEHYAADTYANRKPEMFGTPVRAPVTRISHMVAHGHIARGGHFDAELPDLRSARRLYSVGAAWNINEPAFPHSIWWLTDAPFVGFRIVRPLEPPKTEEEARLYEPDAEVWKTFRWMGGRE
ncbi:MAG: formylglycine-generating enzyme family protein [Planctomycetaceae bacterium]|nr:formylglycine-generating enzyme family protein [Planctomycetaceae bacterium]